MPQQRSMPGTGQSLYDDEPWDGDDDTDELPPRPRRKLITRTTLGVAAVLIAAGGFIGGVEVQKHQGGSSPSSSGLPAGLASRLGGGANGGGGAGAPGGGAASGDFTTGTVANKHGSTLYVKDQDGNTIRIQTSDSSKVTRTAATSSNGVYPGDTVVVTGTKHSDGSITASSIRATSKTAAASGGGGFFGGGPPGGGQSQGGAPPAGGRSAPAAPNGGG